MITISELKDLIKQSNDLTPAQFSVVSQCSEQIISEHCFLNLQDAIEYSNSAITDTNINNIEVSITYNEDNHQTRILLVILYYVDKEIHYTYSNKKLYDLIIGSELSK